MFYLRTVSATVLLCCIIVCATYAAGRTHDHAFDITGTIDASDGTPVNDVEVILEVDKPIYDGITPVKKPASGHEQRSLLLQVS